MLIAVQPFRIDTGIPAEGTALRLSLKDFATEELSQSQATLNQEIIITLSGAESRHQSQTRHQGSINRIWPGVLKRRRAQTPSERLSSEDEEHIERGREIKRGRRSSDNHPSSSPGESIAKS